MLALRCTVKVCCNAWLRLIGFFIQIAIEIGIVIVLLVADPDPDPDFDSDFVGERVQVSPHQPDHACVGCF